MTYYEIETKEEGIIKLVPHNKEKGFCRYMDKKRAKRNMDKYIELNPDMEFRLIKTVINKTHENWTKKQTK